MSFYTFMPTLLNMSLTASVAIVLVILLRLLLKKAPKVISYALWGVVLFRLLCPVSIGSDFSVYNLFDAPTEESGTVTSVIEYVPSNIVHTEYPSVVLPVPGVSDAINEALPQGEEQLRADPLEGPIFIATYVWMAGVLAMVIYSIVSYIRLRRKLSVVVPLRDNIFIADDIKSPFVVGLFRPKIYLPCNLGDKEQEYIILHEQHHIKRLDHVMKALAFLALAIHWFNPLVWIAFILAGKDMEMSCDEAVICKVDGDVRADYSASLLTLATGRRIIAGTPLAFGEGDTKGRINNLSKWKKPAVWVVLLAVVACVILAISLLTNPNSNNDVHLLKYSYTSYISDSEQSEVMSALNRERKPLFVTIKFETTEGPSKVDLVYGYKKNEIKTEWAHDGPVSLSLGESATFTVPANHHFSFTVISLDGENGNVTFVFTESDTMRPDEYDTAPDKVMFEAEVLEIHDGYFLVAPEISWALNSADRIEVPMMNMDPALEPQVGDIIEIACSGEILETYPARLSNVYSISVVQEAQTSSVSMVPTETDLVGVDAGALLLPIGGNTYRYLLSDATPEGVTVDELLYTFTEETLYEGIAWEVYSLKEYPDLSSVLMISGTNTEWLCMYSPPGRCSDTALTDAIAAGYVVMEEGIATHGQDSWKEFYDLTQHGKVASVTIADYHTLDPDRCSSEYYETFRQDYPSLNVFQLSFDGKTYTLSFMSDNKSYTKTYEYLMKYDTTEFYAQSSKTPEGRYTYVLTHDNKVTWEQLWNGLASSQMGAYIDHYSIYSEKKS